MRADRYNRALQAAVALAVEDGIPNEALIDGLIHHLAWIAVGGLPERGPLNEFVEIIRHKLDLAVAGAIKEMQDAKDRSRGSSQRGGAAPDHSG
jgi:hypothetical protein